MTPAPEYAFVSTARFVGHSAAVSSPHLLTLGRTLGPTYALNALGYNARAFSTFGKHAIRDQLAGAKAFVLADIGQSPAGTYRDVIDGLQGRIFYDLFELPAAGSGADDFCKHPHTVLTAA